MSNPLETVRFPIYDVFTPTSPAKLAFVQRGEAQDLLVEAFRTRGKQVIVYGHSGSGKSTLIEHKLFELYEGHITTACMKGMTFESVILNAFDQLDVYYTAAGKEGSSKNVGVEISAQWSKISAAKNVLKESHSARVLPPQLTAQNLARFMGEAGFCWVLEDFHKLDELEKEKLAQAMKVFMDMARMYPDLKSIAVGAASTAREVVQYDNEMRGRVSEIEIPLMTPGELREIIRLGADKLEVEFPPRISESIVKFSNGLASTCHQLCLSACAANGIENEKRAENRQISDASFKKAISSYVGSASDSIRQRFEKATKVKRKAKYNTYEVVLKNMCEFGSEGAGIGDLTRKISENGDGCDINNIRQYVTALQMEDRGEVVIFNYDSGRYSICDPFVLTYMQAYFENRSQSAGDKTEFKLDSGAFVRFITSKFLVSMIHNTDNFESASSPRALMSALDDVLFDVDDSSIKIQKE